MYMNRMLFLLFCLIPAISGLAQRLDSIRHQSVTRAVDTLKIRNLLGLADELTNENPQLAYQHALEARQLAEQHGLIQFTAESALLIGDCLKRTSRCEQAIPYLKEGQTIFSELHLPSRALECANLLAACLIDLRQTDQALLLLEQNINQSRQINDQRAQARGHLLMGAALKERHAPEQAIQHLLTAARLADELNDSRLLSSTYSNLGILFVDMDDIDNARKYLLLAADYRSKINDRHGLAKVYTSLGVLFNKAKEWESARNYLHKALELQQELNNRSGMSQSLQNLGIVYRNLGQYQKALQHYDRSLQIKQELGDQKGECLLYYNRALVLMDLNQPQEALHALDASERLAQQLGLPDLLALIPESRAEAQAMLGQHEASLNEMRRALQARDSLYNLERLQQFNELHAKYETEKKDRELLQQRLDLEQKNAQLQKQKLTSYLLYGGLVAMLIIGILVIAFLRQRQKFEEQKAVERTRAGIARDLHDDIGATLSTVSIYSALAHKQLQIDPARAQSLLDRIRTVSERMMSDMSDVIWMIKPENDSTEKLSGRIRSLAQQLLAPLQIEYRLSLNGGEERLSMKARRDIYLIIKEALTNAAKHSQAKQVEVSMKARDGRLYVRIADDGKGLSAQSSTEHRHVGGNGLGHMQARAEQMGGTLHAFDNFPQGTIIEAEFPLSLISQ